MEPEPNQNYLVLIHWHEAEANTIAQQLTGFGGRIQIGIQTMKDLKANPPLALIISLRRLPSHGREIADALWSTKWGQAIPVLFLDGDAEKVEALKEKFPKAQFLDFEALLQTLETLNAAQTR